MEEKEEDEDKRKKKKARLKEEEYEMTTYSHFVYAVLCTYDVEPNKVGEWCRGIIFASCLCCS